MITFETLGRHGRLGNQMFQYALLLGVRHRLGYEICFDENNTADFFNIFTLPSAKFTRVENMDIVRQYGEQHFYFDPNAFTQDDGTNYWGYFQDYRYFQNIRDQLISEYTFQHEIDAKAHQFLRLIETENTVAVHIRRGDYVNLPDCHPVCSLTYYQQAVSMFDAHSTFIIFSDDIAWCKKNLLIQNCIYSENDVAVDLSIMAKCKHNIIANSTLSWWGAWLNQYKEKQVIQPKVWFGSRYAHHNIQGLYPDGWTAL